MDYSSKGKEKFYEHISDILDEISGMNLTNEQKNLLEGLVKETEQRYESGKINYLNDQIHSRRLEMAEKN